jgi:acetolactate synthase I/II/III large subunit
VAKFKKSRRGFLKGAAASAAALVATPPIAAAQQVRAAAPAAKAAEESAPSVTEVRTEKPGSDFMLDVFKSLGFEYFFCLPGGGTGIQESVINYGGNKDPEYILVMHEESGAAMANGYAKIEGKPAMVCAHGTVGLQHAVMGIYDAFCDRVPVYMVIGNERENGGGNGEVANVHSAQDPAALVRDMTKWDDQPVNLARFAESAVRAYKVAMTPPRMPVVLTIDEQMQLRPVPDGGAGLRIPKLGTMNLPAGDSGAVAATARMLVDAENPIIVGTRAVRSANGLNLMIELAETLQCAVIDQHRRLNFPTRHPLNQTLRATISGKPNSIPVTFQPRPDLVIGLESTDFFDTLRPLMQSGPPPKLITITAGDLFLKANYQDFMRYRDVDVNIAADVETTLPDLIEACKKLITPDRKRFFEARGAKLAEAGRQAIEKHRADAAWGWDESPISTARLSMELYAQIKNEDWSLVTESFGVREWPLRLWDFKKHYQYIGGAGGSGVGYNAPASIGAALANKKHGRLSVSIQADGDLMIAPGCLWTAARHHIPILIVMHNNRAYHQELMEIESTAIARSRGIDRANICAKIENPNIDFARLAQSLGMQAEGPISDPKELAAAFRRGVQAVKNGEPYLIDILTQPR